MDSVSSNPTFTHEVSSYLDFKFIENDAINLLKSGSQWYGDVFDLETTYNYPFSFPEIEDSCHVKLKVVGKSSFMIGFSSWGIFVFLESFVDISMKLEVE